MTPAELSRTVLHAVCRAVEDGALAVPVPEHIGVERPRPGGCGDYATNVALRLARAAGLPPRAVAETLRERIALDPAIASVEITGPGFLNITLGEGSQRDLVRRVLEQGREYGHLRRRAEPAEPEAAVTDDETRARLWRQTTDRLRRTQGLAPAGRPPALPVPAPAHDPGLGSDAVRWGLLAAAAHDRPRLGAPLLRQHESNPLFTVRYAHSRARALTRAAGRLGFTSEPGESSGAPAARLAGLIADYPGVLASAARLHAPDRLVRHLETTADALLAFQHTVLPSGDEKPMAAHRSRLALAEAAGTVLAGGLSLLGVSAPEHL
ncbi:ArgS-related anticodon-binding protein NrtL [Streptomyces sp. NPDC001985]|uniref:ArgS-related anticodon-binding protein NrtL n=1 Tax=Streptomyces sp. NPDC001985 TaxID=3154406 RepID=UPI0033272909